TTHPYSSVPICGSEVSTADRHRFTQMRRGTRKKCGNVERRAKHVPTRLPPRPYASAKSSTSVSATWLVQVSIRYLRQMRYRFLALFNAKMSTSPNFSKVTPPLLAKSG